MEGPSRGKKQCPSCQKFVGVRTYKCACGFDFTSDEYKSSKTKPENADEKKQEVITTSNSNDVPVETYKLTKEDYFVSRWGWQPRKKIFALGHAEQYESPKGVTKQDILDWCSLMMKSLPLTGGAMKNLLLHQGISNKNPEVDAYVEEFCGYQEDKADSPVH